MSVRKIEYPIDDLIKVENVLISVSDKAGLEKLIPSLLDINPQVHFYSTGGTAIRIGEILGEGRKSALIKVEDYTHVPEMDGGLVKTLTPHIHAGLLGERNNPKHIEYLNKVTRRLVVSESVGFPGIDKAIPGMGYGGTFVVEEGNGVFFDLAIVNLYPFSEVIGKSASFEAARGNIDIGGPAMVRAAAKNFMSCAPVVDPRDYDTLTAHIRENGGSTTFDHRLALAKKAFEHTAQYDRAIADHFITVEVAKIKREYQFKEAEKR